MSGQVNHITSYREKEKKIETLIPEGMDRPLRVLHVSADTFGCGFYRCFMPSYFMMEQGYCETRISGSGGATEKEHVEWCDVVVFQRIMEPINDAWAVATMLGKKIVAENDDWYEKVPSGSIAKGHFPRKTVAGINRAMHLADAITVTTDTLKKAYGDLGVPVHVVPNAMECEIDHVYPHRWPKDKFIIGYHGSATHSVDFAGASCALKQIMKEFPFVEVQAIGYFPQDIIDAFPDRVVVRPWVLLNQFYNEIRRLGAHMAIAPIDDCEFNHAKSNLKCLEYGLIRTPWIASRVGPYIDITNRSGGGLLVKNKYLTWYKALRNMITRPPVDLMEMGNNARAYIEKDYNIRIIAEKWYNVFLEVYNKSANPRRVRAFKNVMMTVEDSIKFNQIV